ncbi:RIP metalloprotease RseP (plasmid) [Hymenobacter sp. BRD128]|nr:RIP metalloprotease RseP [Hymenobacter sp. BRD128]
MIGQLVLAMSLLVGLHEFGHFAFAKLFKIRVSKFYIFFDFLFPLPDKLKFSLFKKKVGETEYGIGWFPLGGYVAIHGMVDETQDAAALAGPPQPDEFRSKPAWQRLLVMLGGILLNVATGIVVFSVMTYRLGTDYLPAAAVRYGIAANGLGRSVGFRNGDRIVQINGRPVVEFNDVYDPDLLLNPATCFTVERQGHLLALPPLGRGFFECYSKQGDDSAFVSPRSPFSVAEVVPGFPADQAGLQAGDRILRVAGQPIRFFDELTTTLARHRKEALPFVVQRGVLTLHQTITVNADGKIGVKQQSDLAHGTRYFTPAQALSHGLERAGTVARLQAKALGKMVTGQLSAADNLSGPVEIAQQFGGHWDWNHFWGLVGLLSMVLAFMNLLPIPALDGGHVMFLLYEMLTGRKPSERVLDKAQRVGTMLLMLLMVYVLVVKQVLKLTS